MVETDRSWSPVSSQGSSSGWRFASTLLPSLLIALALLATAAPSARAQADVIESAKALLRAGNAADAFRILDAKLIDFADDEEFNYLLGIAALDDGKPGDAVFALERVLGINPENVLARAELGKAHLALGELEAAERELRTVRDERPPANVKGTIEKYLAAVVEARRERDGIGKTFISGSLEANVGYDSNINTATDEEVVNIPLLGNAPFTLSALFVEIDSPFAGPIASVAIAHRASREVTYFGAVTGGGRFHFEEESFYTRWAKALAGVAIERGANTFRLAVDTSQFLVNRFHVEAYYGATGQWERKLDPNDSVQVFGRFNHMNHPDASRLNARLFLGGVAWSHDFGGRARPRTTVTAYVATEDERRNDPTVGRDYFGGGVSGRFNINQRLAAWGGVGVERSVYHGRDPFFFRTRNDNRYTVSAGMDFTPRKQWTVGPRAIYSLRDSNIATSDFERFQAYLAVRREFQ